jgi:hypothetical protein
LHKRLAGIVFLGFILAPFCTALADIPHYFIRMSCIKDLNLLSVQTFMLWNVCNEEKGDCSRLPSIKAKDVFEISDLYTKKQSLPAKCDLGLGKTAAVQLTYFHTPQATGQGGGAEWGTFTVSVDGEKVAELSSEMDNDLRVTVWKYNDDVRVDVSNCIVSGRTSISIPQNMECSFKELGSGSVFKDQKATYEKVP